MENKGPMDESLERALEQKREEAAYWTQKFQDATAKNDLAGVLALSVTQVKVLADAGNSLIQVSLHMSNQLQHLRIRAHELERLTRWLIVLTIILAVVTLPLSIEATKHLIFPDRAAGQKHQQEMFEGYEKCVSQLDGGAAVNGYGPDWAKARQDCARFWFGAKP